MDSRKSLRIGKKIVHGRKGPLRGDVEKFDENDEMKNTTNIENDKPIIKETLVKNIEKEKRPIKTNYEEQPLNVNKEEALKKTVIGQEETDIAPDSAAASSLDIFEQMLQRELAKGAFGGGVIEKNENKLKSVIQTAEVVQPTEKAEDETADLSIVPLKDRIKHSQVRYRIHGFNEIIKCFSSDDIIKKMEMVDDIFKPDDAGDIMSKCLTDANIMCQLKAAEMCSMYLVLIKDIFFYKKRQIEKSDESDEQLNISFSSEYKTKLFNFYVKINSTLCEKILTNPKSFDHGFSIVCKIIEYCSNDTITANIITMLCDHLNAIVDKAEKNVGNIKGVKIKVVASELLLFYKLFHTYGPSIICAKTINKCCFRFNAMTDKAVKENFYALYIELFAWIKNSDFQNSILNMLSAQQKNHMLKELQKDVNVEKRVMKSTYLIRKGENEMDLQAGGDDGEIDRAADLIGEVDIFSKICTKQWEKRVLEGCFDKASSGGADSLSNENLLPWKIKVEALNLLYTKMKDCYSIKKTPYVSTILNILGKLLKNESAIPVIISCLKLLTVCIHHFGKDIFTSIRANAYLLCSKLKDSNKQVSITTSECIIKSLEFYNIDIYLDDLSKNLKDKNNNSRLVTIELLIKIIDLVDKKGASQIVELTKQTINDPIANIKNASFKLFAKIISLYGEEIAPAFFNSIPANKKKSILTLCSNVAAPSSGKRDCDMTTSTGSISGRGFKDTASSVRENASNGMNGTTGSGKVGHGARKGPKEVMATSGYSTKNIIPEDSVERILPDTIVAGFISNNYIHKIEALHVLHEWINDKKNFNIINLDLLLQFIKKNSFDFKGKYVQLNAAIFDFFYNLIDTIYHFNAHETNPDFSKIINNILVIYLEKIIDKREGMVCNNFVAKCFNYFDNSVILESILKNSDPKNTKKCEECIKLLQKILITKNSTHVNVKNLILFLKKFVDSKNTNLRNATILLLQILSRNFGDRLVLSHLEGIAESVRQSVKMKEDIERFLTRQGITAMPSTTALLGKNAKTLNNSVTSMTKMSTAGTGTILGTNTPKAKNIAKNTDKVEKFPQKKSENETEIEQIRGSGNKNIFAKMENKEYESKDDIQKYKESVYDDVTENKKSVRGDGKIEIDYNSKNLNYTVTTKKEGIEQKSRRYSGEGNETDMQKVRQRDSTHKRKEKCQVEENEEEQEENIERGEVSKEEEEEEEPEKKMVSISEIVKPYIYKLNKEINKNVLNNTTLKIINIFEENARHHINPEGLEILLNKSMLQKIYSINKNMFTQFLNVVIVALRETPETYSSILFFSIINLVDDEDITDEAVDRLLLRLAKTIGISLYIKEINSFMFNERMDNSSTTDGTNITKGVDLGGGKILEKDSTNNNNSNATAGAMGTSISIKSNRRNKILVAVNAIRLSHLLLLNENTIKKRILKLYIDLFFDDHEELREMSSIVLDHIYSKFGGDVFFYAYERLSAHQKECFQDIINKMKTKGKEFSFHSIFLSNNSQIKRISINTSNPNMNTPSATKMKSAKRVGSSGKSVIMEKIEFPANYKIKPDKLKWGSTLDANHYNYLTKEFKCFANNELINNMFSGKINLIDKSITFYREYLENGANQSVIYARTGFTDLLLKWIFFIINGKPHIVVANLVNLILLILRKMEHNYAKLSDQLLYCFFCSVFNKIDFNSTTDLTPSTSTTSATYSTPSEIRRNMKKILLCLCYTSNEKLYFSLLLKSLASCQQEIKLSDSLDIILKLVILFKEKCIKFENDVIVLLQILTLNSKKKHIAFSCLRIFANIQSFYPNFYECVENQEISNYLKEKVNQFIKRHPDYNKCIEKDESDDDNASVNSGHGSASKGEDRERREQKKDQEDEEGEEAESENNIMEYIKNNASQRQAIRDNIREKTNENNESFKAVQKLQNDMKNTDLLKTHTDCKGSHIAYNALMEKCAYDIKRINYTKAREVYYLLDMKKNENPEEVKTYYNSILYFKFLYMASCLYTETVTTIAKVCKVLVEMIVVVGEKSEVGNFILTEDGKYVFNNVNLYLTLMKGINNAMRFLFIKSVNNEIQSPFIHYNAILNVLLLVDILVKKKSTLSQLSYDYFYFFFTNVIMCLSVYTKEVHYNKYIFIFKNGDVTRNLIIGIMNNIVGREFLSVHTKLLEYAVNAVFNMGFKILKNNKMLNDELDTNDTFFISVYTYVRVLNKTCKKVILKMREMQHMQQQDEAFDGDTPLTISSNNALKHFVYRMLHILFIHLNRFMEYTAKREKEKKRLREGENEPPVDACDASKRISCNTIGTNSSIIKGNKRMCIERGSESFRGVDSEHSSISVIDFQNADAENDSKNNSNSITDPGTGRRVSGTTWNKLYERTSVSATGANVMNTQQYLDHGATKKEQQRISTEEQENINKKRVDLMDKYLYFLQIIFLHIKDYHPTILFFYIDNEIIKKYKTNTAYYFEKAEFFLNKNLKNITKQLNIKYARDDEPLNFSFHLFVKHFKNEIYGNQKKNEQAQAEGVESHFTGLLKDNNLMSYTDDNFDSEKTYDMFLKSMDEVFEKKKDFLYSLKISLQNRKSTSENSSSVVHTTGVANSRDPRDSTNTSSANNENRDNNTRDNQYKQMRKLVIEYINDLEQNDLKQQIENSDTVLNYEFLCSMYRVLMPEKEEATEKDRVKTGGGAKLRSIEQNVSSHANQSYHGVGTGRIVEQVANKNTSVTTNVDTHIRREHKINTNVNMNRETERVTEQETETKTKTKTETETERDRERIRERNRERNKTEENTVTFVSNNIYLRNQTIENTDMVLSAHQKTNNADHIPFSSTIEMQNQCQSARNVRQVLPSSQQPVSNKNGSNTETYENRNAHREHSVNRSRDSSKSVRSRLEEREKERGRYINRGGNNDLLMPIFKNKNYDTQMNYEHTRREHVKNESTQGGGAYGERAAENDKDRMGFLEKGSNRGRESDKEIQRERNKEIVPGRGKDRDREMNRERDKDRDIERYRARIREREASEEIREHKRKNGYKSQIHR